MNQGVDNKSLGMCMISIFLKVWGDMTLNEAATILAALAALTTIIYNVFRTYKEWKQK